MGEIIESESKSKISEIIENGNEVKKAKVS